ncbi:hypothetical protein P4S63_24135 [Pseudoalteromonas sp. B193]
MSIPNLFFTDTRNRDLVPPYARQDVNTQGVQSMKHLLNQMVKPTSF